MPNALAKFPRKWGDCIFRKSTLSALSDPRLSDTCMISDIWQVLEPHLFFLKKKLRQENIKKLATISSPFILLRFCNSIHPPLTECPASSSHDVKNNSFLSKLHHRVASLSSLPSLPSPYWLMHGNIMVAHFDCWAPLGSTGQLQNASRSLREELQLDGLAVIKAHVAVAYYCHLQRGLCFFKCATTTTSNINTQCHHDCIYSVTSQLASCQNNKQIICRILGFWAQSSSALRSEVIMNGFHQDQD